MFYTYRKVLVITGLVSCLFSSVFAYSGGSGEPNNPYRIASVSDWNNLMTTSADWNKYFIMTADVNLAGVALTPVGNGSINFTGVFDGNNHIIHNADINLPNSNYVGLFGCIGSNGQIRNLGVADVNIIGNYCVGGLAGNSLQGTTISNCFSTGKVTGSSNGYVIGGLAGANRGTISNCFSTDKVTGDSYTGGLVGSNLGNISRCYASGNVAGSTKCIGGLVGYNSGGIISDCYATGTVCGNSYVGGLVGNNILFYSILDDSCREGSIDNCYATGNITGSDQYTGGLVGYNSGSHISNCYATGTILGNSYAGGLVGRNLAGVYHGDFKDYIYGVITNCYAAGIVSGHDYVGGLVGYNYGDGNYGHDISGCYATGTVIGNNYVGGLIGSMGNNSYRSGSITGCYSTGTVSGNSYVGGLVGSNSGTITDCYATGRVSGNSYVGGLAGSVGDSSRSGSVTSCYSTGTVSGNSYIGGLAGYKTESSSISTSFWDIQTSGWTTSAGGIGKTTAQMKTLSTFTSAGWDFTTIDGDVADWIMPENNYPYLAWKDRKPAKVPDVNGMSFEEAADTVKNAGLVMGSLTLISSHTVPVGYVVSQDPAADSNGTVGVTKINLTVSCPNEIGSGSGTETDPYQIKTVYEWLFLTSHPELWDKDFILMNDLDFRDGVISPIGNSGIKFTGEFDGSGHIIRNAGVNMPNSDDVGLFGYVGSGSQIRNLGVENIGIVGKSYVGGLAGSNHGTIIDCYVAGIVVGRGDRWSIGGLAGENLGSINACYATGTVTGGGSVGGLVGDNMSTITNCYAISIVSGGDEIGGLTGDNYDGSIENCYATGTVTGNDTVGGLVGENDGSVENCYAMTMVSGNDSIGGLVGYDYYGNLITCYATGTVTGNINVGGMVGYNNNGSVEKCYATGTGTVSGHNYVGGLVGYDYYGNLTACYAAGAVSGNSYVGGLVGFNDSGNVSSSFWDVETSGQATSAGGIGLTTSQMKSVTTYQNVGWADNGWVINDGLDYPHLAWENTGGVPIPQPQSVPLSGSGTEQDPYQIWTANDFVLLNWYVTVQDKHFVLMADLDLAGIVFYPIGDLGFSFTGVFEGNGHTIRNVNINKPGSNTIGLFASINAGGKIRNLGIEDINVIGNMYVGGLVGINYGTITGCHVSGTVKSTSPYSYVGGLVGINNSDMDDCYAIGTVTGVFCVGGLIGYNDKGAITGCYTAGTVGGIGNSNYVGGLIGWNSGRITVCHATETVNGGGSCTGGLLGISSGNITACYATGAVGGGGNSAGGLVGQNSGGNVTTCYATGAVNGGYSFPDDLQSCYSGGLIGYNDGGIITDCYAAGAVSGKGKRIGGLVGQNNNGDITACYAAGKVIGSGNTVGGLVGYNNRVITDCYAIGDVAGNQYIGGLTGYNYGTGIITDCYSVGAVTANGLFGGLVGVNDSGNVSSSLWDIEASGQMTSAGGEGKTTTEMRDVNTFLNAGWDFVGETANGTEDIWEMRANGADYPHLRWDSRRPVYLYSGGLGTEADPYKISTISDWRRLMNTSLHWNKYFIMMNDLDFKNSGIFIIGSDSTPFTGVFNGNGHIIRNVDINNPLFGSVGPSGQIRNLGVEDVNITGSGSLVGYNQGSITGCNVTGAVTGKDQVGGLVGSNGGTISNCYITGAITGGDGSGGLAGDNSGTITDCCAVVTVIGGNYSVGGLVGSNGGAIINCCAAGTVTGVLYVGGLAGANSGGVIIACYATGIVTGEDIVGGLVGYNYYGSVENCYAMGTSNGNENIGGLVGFDYYGNLTTCYAAGAVSGSSYIGGLTGDNAYNTTTACFWDVETTGQATSAAGTGKTTAEMKTLSTFTSAGWDFADIWGIGENQTYPFLRKYSLGDLNYDGIVNFVDFALFADGWFEGVQ